MIKMKWITLGDGARICRLFDEEESNGGWTVARVNPRVDQRHSYFPNRADPEGETKGKWHEVVTLEGNPDLTIEIITAHVEAKIKADERSCPRCKDTLLEPGWVGLKCPCRYCLPDDYLVWCERTGNLVAKDHEGRVIVDCRALAGKE